MIKTENISYVSFCALGNVALMQMRGKKALHFVWHFWSFSNPSVYYDLCILTS